MECYRTYRKLTAVSRAHRSTRPDGHQNWPKHIWDRKIYVVSISKTKQDAAVQPMLLLNNCITRLLKRLAKRTKIKID